MRLTYSQFNYLQLLLCWSLVAFSVATVVLAIQRAKLNADVREMREKLDYLESLLEGQIKPHRHQIARREATTVNEKIDYRLPSTLFPIHYDLYLHPEISTGIFNGEETITIAVRQPTHQIILHAFKLIIKSVIVHDAQQRQLDVASFRLETLREYLIIDMMTQLEIGTVTLTVTFEGQMQDKIVGLYSSSYVALPSMERRTIATSKFEPTYARQAFPCFDEPAMKATFNVTLIRPTGFGYHALSNMNEEQSITQDETTAVHFAESMPMSTYLTCFIVSDFAHQMKSVNSHGIGSDFDIRIFATTHQLAKTDFALTTAVAVTEFYIQYFKMEYPLPKLDMAAIPDFVSNAMEHWGLLTYRETALLYDQDYSSTWNKQRIASVVAHELAHNWFGNLVTMQWWNDLWLNEGFARYMEYKGVHQVYPDWGMTDQFLLHAMHNVLKYDSTVASHPIIQTVENPDQITEIFDTISYEKGASVIRMLEDVVGPQIFAQAVTNYLDEYKYRNAITDNFIAEVAKLVPDFDVTLFMRTWTEQMGLPVVEVRRSSATMFVVTQKRFFANIEDYGIAHSGSEFNYTWTIPLTFFSDVASEIHRRWFDYDALAVQVPVDAQTRWIKLNARQVGFYRVNYEPAIWEEIIVDLLDQPNHFEIADRAHLLNDAFALADASQLSYETALDMTKYLAKEEAFVPWYVATTKLRALQWSLQRSPAYLDYLRYVRHLIGAIYRRVGWTVDEDNHLRNRLRVSVLTAACSFGLPECLTEAANRFTAWLAAPANKPSPDLREIIYYYGMERVGKQDSWEQMWNLFVAEQDASEKLKLMYGLSAIREPWLLFRFIELASNEQFVRRQDYFACIQNIAANPAGEPLVWDYVREHWPALVERFTLNDRSLGRMISTITEHFDTDTQLESMQHFFAKYPEAGAGMAARKQALETVKFNIKWLAENELKVATWLTQQQ